VEPQVARITLPGIQETIRTELDGAFAELGRIIAADYAVIDEVSQYLLGIRGKMFRPTLLLLASRAAGGPRPDDTTLAAVVELIHLATLIHDDSVDHSVLRRGQPTVNALFSHEVAVIMGDYLYSRAIIELVNVEDREPLRVMSRVTNDMTVGEMRELEAHDELDFSEQRYLRMIEAKTASLMAGACEVGAIPGGEMYREPLRRYGHQLGMAFQIVDDLLDYTSTEDVTGKPAGLDLREHKITLPLIAALPEMDRDEWGLAEALMADPTPSDDLIATLIDVVERRGGTEAARARAQEFGRRAEEALDHVPAGRERDVLRDCVTYAVERQS
jgi:octaprenyl-diphosphate synthase